MRSLKCLFAIIFAICTLLQLGLFRNTSAAPSKPVALYTVYLPGVSQGSRTTTTLPTTTPPPATPTPSPNPSPAPEPPANNGALFLEPDQKTAGPNMLTDAQGGLHTAYFYYISENEGGPHVVYSYCPSATQCSTSDKWARVSLPMLADEVQLQLTPDGHPRILSARSFVGTPSGIFLTYTYAECDQNCLDAANWSSVDVTAARQGYMLDPRELPRRYFALDRQGHPHFVFSDSGSNLGNGEQRYGSYIYGCDADCTVAENWSGSLYTHPDPNGGYRGDVVGSPVLKFTSTNQPRVFGQYFPALADFGFVTPISYFACDDGCDSDANWTRTDLTPRGNGPEPGWDLELDANDHPRAVVYHEETKDDTNQRLFYYQCDSNCTDASAWQAVNFELDQTIGRSPDLSIDAAGHPRIAHLVNHGALAYSECNNACDQAGNWQHNFAEKVEALDTTDPVAIPPSCAPGIWSNYGVSLALDPQGNPRIAYNAVYYANCLNLPHPGRPPTSGFQEIAHRVRVFYAK